MADVFISWSGPQSKHVAGILYKFLPRVIQGLDVFFSDQDIPSGTQWMSEIQSHLASAKYGIICVTPENTNSAWLYFEAGAISRQTTEPVSRVSPVAVGMSKEALPSPLQGYNAIDLNEEGFVKMVKSIHETVESSAPWPTIEEAAQYYWSLMDKELEVKPTAASPAPVFDQKAALIEIRSLVRELASRTAQAAPGYNFTTEQWVEALKGTTLRDVKVELAKRAERDRDRELDLAAEATRLLELERRRKAVDRAAERARRGADGRDESLFPGPPQAG